ncbi:MAG: acyl-CoA thioesterase, partial [Frankiales bacterium]|nr:acyl-CoA thioesterase [Frankiales bacterium]
MPRHGPGRRVGGSVPDASSNLRAMTTRTVDVLLDPGWTVGGKPHGGYLLAEAAKAALDDTHPHPLALSAHYLSSPDPAVPASVTVEPLRRGRRASSSQLQLRQAQTLNVAALLTAGRLEPAPAPDWSAHAPVELPVPEQCVRLLADRPDGLEVATMLQLEVRLDPADAGFVHGAPGGRAVMRGWVRRLDGTPTSVTDNINYAHAHTT